MSLVKDLIIDLVKRLDDIKRAVDLVEKKKQVKKLAKESQNQKLWQDRDKGQALIQKLSGLKDELGVIEEIDNKKNG